jgi:hypothetical protein
MAKSYNKVKSKIAVVSVLPSVRDSELGELVYLTADDKIYVKIITGWVKTSALT